MSDASVKLPTTGIHSGLEIVTDINAALDALRSTYTGASAPSADTPEEGQLWLDTSHVGAGFFPIIREYDGSGWVALGVLDTGSHTIWPNTGPIKTTTGTGAAYVLDTTPYEPIATPTTGFRLRIKIHLANTGACTLAVNGGTAYPIRTAATVDLTATNLSTNMVIELTWIASEWLIVNAISPVIADSAITYAKIQTMTNARLLGNFSGGSTHPQEVALGSGLTVAGTTSPVISVPFYAPNTQIFLSTGTATYTTPTNGGNLPLWIHIRMVGGGGGGGGVNNNGGAIGGDSAFAGWTAIHGNGGSTSNNTLIAAGGTGGVDSTGNKICRINGGYGGPGGAFTGDGGDSFFISGPRGHGGSAYQPAAAAANSGAGGGGGFNGVGSYGNGAGGGEFLEIIIAPPSTSYSYTVGNGGTGGVASSTTQSGGDGAAGRVEVIAYWQ